ncbi:lysylphosphatidylglycerol synthase transmembrane domain-containing protein [Clostridium septicum]|uniref:lysylphosphatidylglycerol synthase transmembrane domain-containing protein n=1 Tax=Clostridium septicum TaxID=1504 RepID=UPI00082C0E8D|nr:lysylphosphatidylglycerol synthase transmembrane domain-containing protein [Clostridium septicum]
MSQYINKKKTSLYLLVLIVITFFIYLTIFKNQDFSKIAEVIASANPIIIICATSLIILFIFCEAFNINLLLNSMNYNISFLNSIKYAITGFFYSSITPSSTGGQPMQLYKMKRDGINLSHGTLVLLVELACFQTVTLILGGISLIWASMTNIQITSFIKFLAVLGFFINILIVISIWISIFSKSFSEKVYGFICFLVNKLFFISEIKKEKIIYSLKSSLKKYNECAEFLKKQPILFLKCLSITTIQVVGLFSIPYVVYLALNEKGTSFISMFIIQSIVYLASSFIPMPGAAGISENNYISLFSKIYPIGVLNSAVLLTRVVNFYLPLIITFIALLGIEIASKKR